MASLRNIQFIKIYFMTNNLTIFLITVLIVSCNKNVPVTPPSRFDQLKTIVDSMVGTYTTTSICTEEMGIHQFYSDTTYNVKLTITSVNDTIIVINGQTMTFDGDLSKKYYDFSYIYSSDYIYIDSLFRNLIYKADGGTGFPPGCTLTGTK